MAARALHTLAQQTANLLGSEVRAARLDRGWTVADLAERAGVSAPTVLKVEHGDASVALGTALECAVLVGVPLFYDDERRLVAEAERGRKALLRRRARSKDPEVSLDF